MNIISRFRKIALAALAGLALPLLAMSAQAQEASEAETPARYLFLLSTGDMPAAGSALHLALTAADSGRDVDVLLLASGLDLGRQSAMMAPEFAPYGADGSTMLKRAMRNGARVSVCQICLNNTGITMDAMLGGIERVNAFDVFEMMEAADVLLNFGTSASDTGITILDTDTPTAPVTDDCDPATDPDMCM